MFPNLLSLTIFTSFRPITNTSYTQTHVNNNSNIEWPDLQPALKSRLANVLDQYMERNNDCKDGQYEEPNVEKFNLESSRDEILELISSFTEPPFTIQRICELLCSPFQYYDRVSTFIRGLEKNLRVISSNDWPKSHNDDNNINNSNNNNNNEDDSSKCISNNDTEVDESSTPSSDDQTEPPQAQSSEPQDQDVT